MRGIAGRLECCADAVHTLNYSSTIFRNAYESIQAGCTNGSSTVCCNATSYSFGHNQTAFLAFAIADTNDTGLNYTMAISSNGTFDAEVEFDMLASGRSQSSVGVAVTPSTANTDQRAAVNFTGFTLLVPNGQPTAEGAPWLHGFGCWEEGCRS